jgi:hypothetical protein
MMVLMTWDLASQHLCKLKNGLKVVLPAGLQYCGFELRGRIQEWFELRLCTALRSVLV